MTRSHDIKQACANLIGLAAILDRTQSTGEQSDTLHDMRLEMDKVRAAIEAEEKRLDGKRWRTFTRDLGATA